MYTELSETATACSWTALFATVWFRRALDHADRDLDTDRAHARRRQAAGKRHRRPLEPGRRGTPSSTRDPHSSANHGGTGVAVGDEARGDETAPWIGLDLLQPAAARTGARFDDTVAWPIDAPQRLDAIVQAAISHVRALPPVEDLDHRTIAHRARLQQIARDAADAQARLAAGTYGSCLSCEEPISLVVLTDRPWDRLCIYCALDI